MRPNIRLLLVDDHEFVALAVAEYFEGVADIDLVATASTIEDAVVETRRHRPDVVLLDRRLPDGDGVGAIGRLGRLAPDTRVLLFTGAADRTIAARVAEVGGAGILLKSGLVDEMADTIRRVAAGEDAFDVELPGRPAGR